MIAKRKSIGLILLIIILTTFMLFAVGCSSAGIKITFDTDGGSSVRAITIKDTDVAIKMPAAPNKDGHYFMDWYIDEARTIPFNPNNIPTTDITLYALWEIRGFTITFNAKLDNENEYETIFRTVPYGGSLIGNLPSVPKRIGYTGSWDLTDINASDIKTDSIIYAIYTLEMYSMTFNIPGTAEAIIIEKNMGEEYEKPSDPTRVGYLFGGWYTDKTYTEPFIFPTLMPSNNIELHAWWVKKTDIGEFYNYEATDYVDEEPTAIRITGMTRVAGYQTNMLIPSEIEGLPVKYIGYDTPYEQIASADMGTYAIFNSIYLKSIIIPSSIELIGTLAFNKAILLESISFMDNSQLVSIGDAAFLNCTKIQKVYIPSNVEHIGDYAFGGINLEEGEEMLLSVFNIADNSNLTTLGKAVFKECKILQNFRVPKTINEQIVYDGDVINYDYGFHRIFEDSGIKYFTVEEGHQNLRAIEGVLFSADGNTLLYYPNMGECTYTIPETNAIGPNAFRNNQQLQSIIIANNITTINGYAFYNAKVLKTVTFGSQSSLININEYAFSGVKEITDIVFPDTLQSINDSAFSAIGDVAMGLKNISLPDGLIYIGKSAFKLCSNLSKFSIPSSIQVIDDYAFYDCHLLNVMYDAEIDLKECALERIGNYAFYRCFNVITLDLPPSLLEIGDYAFSNDNKYTSNMQLRNFSIASDGEGQRSLASIGEGAFENCVYLEEINISENVSNIGQRAFYNCKAVRVIFNRQPLNTVLQKIEPYTFYGCTVMSTITIPRTVKEVGEYAFFGNSSLVTVQSGDELNRSAITKIGNSAFEGCNKLLSNDTVMNQSLIFPNTKEVGKRAFYGCSALNYIRIVDSLISIGEEAFAYCISLNTIRYGQDVKLTTLTNNVFRGCDSITEFIIPNSIMAIEGNPFSDCDNLISFRVDEVNQYYRAVSSVQQDYNVLYSKVLPKTIVLFPTGIVTQYEVPSDVEVIAPYAFYSSKITKLTFAGDAIGVAIGDYAFSECKGLVNITIPQRVNSVGNYAFYNNTSLYSITISEATDNQNTLTIGGYAFGNNSVTSMTIPERIISIGEYAFNGCFNLAQVTFSQINNDAKNLIIDSYAFYECSKLTQLSLPNRLTQVNDFAFSWCVGLKTITFDSSERELVLGNNVFDNCHLIKNIVLPNRTVEMGSHLFNGCSFLERAEVQALDSIVYRPEGVELGENAFINCNELRTVVIPNHINKIGDYAFYDCNNLIEIIFVDGDLALEIGSYAMSECDAMVNFEIPARTTLVGSYAFYNSGLGRTALYTIKDKQKVVAYKQNLTFAESTNALVLGEYSFASTSLSNIIIPQRVTQIGSFAFRDNKNLVLISFEENSNCEEIGEGAFQNIATKALTTSNELYERLIDYDEFVFEEEIRKFVLPMSLKILGDAVFKDSSNIWDISLNEGLTTIGESAFYGLSKITYIDLPSSVTTIGNNAFQDCVALQNVTIRNEGDYSLGSYTFAGCESLVDLSLKKVSMIGFAPAYGCENLKILTVSDDNDYYKTIGSVLFTKNVTYGTGEEAKTYTEDEMILLYPAGKEGSTYAVNRNTKELGSMAFSGNKYLTSISIDAKDASVITIATDTFENTALNLEFFVPSTHEFIYKQNNMWRPFAYKIKSSAESIENFIIQRLSDDEDSCKIIKYIGLADSGDRLVIPTSLNGLKVKEIGENALSHNSILKTVKTPQGLSTIANNAFAHCISLESIDISDSVQEIGEYAFQNCINLNSVNLGEGSLLSMISNYSFQNCVSLESITLPWRISSIGMFAFAGTDETPMSLKTINIPPNSILANIDSYAFQYASSLNTITIPQSVTMLGMRVFYGCSSLTSVLLERGVNQSVTQLQNEYVFDGTPTELMIYVNKTARQEYVKARYWKNIATSIGETESLDDQYSLETIEYTYDAIEIMEYKGILNPDNITYNKGLENQLIMPEMVLKLPRVTIQAGNKTFSTKTNDIDSSRSYKTLQNHQTQTIILIDSEAREHTLTMRKVTFTMTGKRLLKYLGAETEIIVPSQIQGVQVLEIGSYCFNYKIERITIPEGILKINSNAFRYSTRLKYAKLPMSLSVIEANAFRGTALESVMFGSNSDAELLASRLITIGDYAFADCLALVNFVVSQQVETIGDYAFASTDSNKRMSLTDVRFLGNKMKSIGKYVFYRTNIVTITLPENLEKIGEGAFKNCYYLLSIYLNDASETRVIVELEEGTVDAFAECNFVKIYVKNYKLRYYKSGDSSWSENILRIFSSENVKNNGFTINIKDEDAKTAEIVHYIGNETDIIIPNQIAGYTIKVISSYVFNYNVKRVTVPNTVEEIRSYAFYNSGVEEVVFEGDSKVMSIGEYAFYDTPLNTIEIPLSVTSIGVYAFANTELTNITFESPYQLVTEGENITPSLTIGGYVFSNNENLTNISLPRRVLTLGQYVFFNNPKLTNIELPLNGQLFSISNYAFSHCSSLEKIAIPFSVKQMHTSIFDYCTSLKFVYIMRGKDGIDVNEVDGLTTIGPGMFNNIVNPFLKVYVPRNSLNEYRNMQYWKSYAGQNESGVPEPSYPDYIVPHLIEGDFSYAILDASSIELTHYRGTEVDLTIPGEMTIGTITYNVKTIGRYFGNSSLRSVVMEEGYRQQLDLYAFSECTALERIALPATIETIGNYSFNNCTSLKTVNIPEGIVDINEGLFKNCHSIKELHLPSTVLKINGFAFANCSSLVRLHLNTAGVIEGDGSMLMNSSPYLRIFVSSEYVNSYRTKTNWSHFASGIISKDNIYGNFAIEVLQNGGIRILQYIGYERDMYMPSRLRGREVESLASDSIIDYVENIYIPEDSTIHFVDNKISDRVVYY